MPNLQGPEKAELVLHTSQRWKRGAYEQRKETGPKRVYTRGAPIREQVFGDALSDPGRKRGGKLRQISAHTFRVNKHTNKKSTKRVMASKD